MKKFFLLLSSSIMAVSLIGISPAGAAQPEGAQPEASGGFALTVHSHSDRPETLLNPDVERLSYDFEENDTFAYSSRMCSGNAAFNDVGLDFRPDYPGVDDDGDGTAPVRHYVEGTVTEVNGATGTIEGTITTVLCVTDENGLQTESENVIVTEFTAKYRQVSDNELRLTGTFEISPTLSTGTFEGLEGSGSLQASLLCLANQRDPSKPSCADLGEYTDFVASRGDASAPAGKLKPGLVGSFRDATVEPV